MDSGINRIVRGTRPDHQYFLIVFFMVGFKSFLTDTEVLPFPSPFVFELCSCFVPSETGSVGRICLTPGTLLPLTMTVARVSMCSPSSISFNAACSSSRFRCARIVSVRSGSRNNSRSCFVLAVIKNLIRFMSGNSNSDIDHLPCSSPPVMRVRSLFPITR